MGQWRQRKGADISFITPSNCNLQGPGGSIGIVAFKRSSLQRLVSDSNSLQKDHRKTLH
jgi:hypothetical protein